MNCKWVRPGTCVPVRQPKNLANAMVKWNASMLGIFRAAGGIAKNKGVSAKTKKPQIEHEL